MSPKTEWGTDHWGEVMSEPTEGHARGVARITGANIYSRPPMGRWVKEGDQSIPDTGGVWTMSDAEFRRELGNAWDEGAQAGFASTSEGFNGECAFDHCAPDNYPPVNPYRTPPPHVGTIPPELLDEMNAHARQAREAVEQ